MMFFAVLYLQPQWHPYAVYKLNSFFTSVNIIKFILHTRTGVGIGIVPPKQKIQLGSLGECCKLSQWKPGVKPQPQKHFYAFWALKTHLMATSLVVYVQCKWLLRKISRPLCGHGLISWMGPMLQRQ